jgi:hypothetical protein
VSDFGYKRALEESVILNGPKREVKFSSSYIQSPSNIPHTTLSISINLFIASNQRNMKGLGAIFRRKNHDLPSVTDFESSDALQRVLGGKTLQAKKARSDSSSSLATVSTAGGSKRKNIVSNSVTNEDAKVVDWKLPTFDAETTHVQTLENEMQRLLVLRSFCLLDSGHEEHFDRLVQLAAEMFHVPIALISLVDLGRQWFLSQEGLENITETPRNIAVCAHVVQGKSNKPLVIPDLSQDFRFKDTSIVTGPLGLRFYAGAPLISPEGQKIGSFCIIDTVARPPDGFTSFDEEVLTDLANMAMKIMVERRDHLALLQKGESKTPMSVTEIMERFDRIISPAADVQKLYQSLNTFIEPLPKSVPITMELDRYVPLHVECDDLLLFRSCLILLNNAATRTKSGTIHFHIKVKKRNQSIVFECEDTGYPMFDPDVKFVAAPKSPLLVMSAMVRKMNGKYGLSSIGPSKSVFWFSVPLKPTSVYASIADTKIVTGTAPTSTLLKVHSANVSSTPPDSIETSTKKLKDLIVRDPFDDVVSQIGCTPLVSYKPKAQTIEKYEV